MLPYTIPYDPQILVSFINTHLRDSHKDLDALCADMEINKKELVDKLRKIEYEYDPAQNKFI